MNAVTGFAIAIVVIFAGTLGYVAVKEYVYCSGSLFSTSSNNDVAKTVNYNPINTTTDSKFLADLEIAGKCQENSLFSFQK
jgi:hypothetical protein